MPPQWGHNDNEGERVILTQRFNSRASDFDVPRYLNPMVVIRATSHEYKQASQLALKGTLLTVFNLNYKGFDPLPPDVMPSTTPHLVMARIATHGINSGKADHQQPKLDLCGKVLAFKAIDTVDIGPTGLACIDAFPNPVFAAEARAGITLATSIIAKYPTLDLTPDEILQLPSYARIIEVLGEI